MHAMVTYQALSTPKRMGVTIMGILRPNEQEEMRGYRWGHSGSMYQTPREYRTELLQQDTDERANTTLHCKLGSWLEA